MPRKKVVKSTRVEEVEELGISETKAEEKIETEDKMLKSSPMGRFIILEVVGGFRVARNHQWVSGVLASKDAVKLASDMNRKDPEQKPYNRYLMGNTPPMRGINDIQGL